MHFVPLGKTRIIIAKSRHERPKPMTSDSGRAWPHPDDPVSLTKAAAILKVDRRTLERNVEDIRTGGRPRTPRVDVAAVCSVFAGRPEGTAAKPPARELITAVSDDPADFEGLTPTARPKTRLRIQKKEITSWRRLSPQRLAEEMRDAWLRMESRETKNAKRRVLEIAEVMRERQVPMPEKWLTPESVMVFASMADWAGRAPPHAVWPFLLGRSGRPVDLVTATSQEMRSGLLAFLTPGEYGARLSASLIVEAAATERLVLAKDAGEAAAPPRNRKMSSGPASSGYLPSD